MREKTMKRGHLLLTLLAFVSLMWLGTIHANAAMVKAKVDVKKFYGIAEQVLQEINKERRSNGLQDLKMDATLTEAAMNIALQKQGGDASVSEPEIYNDRYIKRIEAGNSVDEELMNVIELISIILGGLKGEDENGK